MNFDRLANNAKIAGLVARYVKHYARKSGQRLEPPSKPWELPSIQSSFSESVDPLDSPQLVVQNVVSDFVANLAHYASVNGVPASEVITDAVRNFANEISGDESHESCGKLDANLGRLRTLLEEIVFDATIGTVSDKTTDEVENESKEQA